jgi:hypothetical protein
MLTIDSAFQFTAQPQAPAAAARKAGACGWAVNEKRGIPDLTNTTTREKSPLNRLSPVARSSVIETVAISGWRIPPVQAPGKSILQLIALSLTVITILCSSFWRSTFESAPEEQYHA